MSDIIDTRDLHERLEELEHLQSEYDLAKEIHDGMVKDLEEYQSKGAKNDSAVESEEKILEYEKEIEEYAGKMEEFELDADDASELEDLLALKDEVGGEWEYGATLIPEYQFEEYCQELVEDIGDLPKDLPNYIVIDWAATADNLRADYSSTTFRGEDYLYRAS